MKDHKNTKKSDVSSETKKELTEIEKVQAERDEYLHGWQRAKADAINARKRMEEDMKIFRQMANQGLLEDLLPVLQSFEVAFANKELWEKADKNWRMGVEHIYHQLKSVLETNGLSEINPVLGEKFDPMRDDVSEHIIVNNEKQNGVTMRVIERGYALNGKLIKPPKIAVGEFKK